MKKICLILFLTSITFEVFASVKYEVIKNFENVKNLSFEFEQNINGKIENGKCVVEYPKKIFCEYDLNNKKILVSNGRSLVIKTTNSFYIYPLDKTVLNLILDKEFLIKKIKKSNERIVDGKFINFNFSQDENEINVFFDNKTFNLIGWQTLDIYQNLSITYLNSIIKNKKLKNNLFKLPAQN
ncbi:outer-membrane lipoprotein carrier protein LolA [Candidatus Pelagibacter sp.]|jgi:outer membrane lipoprotein-sorting protein|nr:outer-membrane lipoprotein carrier protein LolA [Candidatus Pelagibacter sp.]